MSIEKLREMIEEEKNNDLIGYIEEIKEMVNNDFSISKQIEFLVKSGALKKLSRKRYENFLKKYIEEDTAKTPPITPPTKKEKQKDIKEVKEVKGEIKNPLQNLKSEGSALEKDVDLFALGVNKKIGA